MPSLLFFVQCTAEELTAEEKWHPVRSAFFLYQMRRALSSSTVLTVWVKPALFNSSAVA